MSCVVVRCVYSPVHRRLYVDRIEGIMVVYIWYCRSIYSLWSEIIATLLSATGGNFSVIHVDYVDFVPESGRQFRSRNL